jgi:ATP-binding cassette subfamily B protein
MKPLILFKALFRKFPDYFYKTMFLLLVEFVFDLLSIFAVAPVMDFLLKQDSDKFSQITHLFVRIFEDIGLPVNLLTFLGTFLFFQVLKNGFFIFARYCILDLKYAVLKGLFLESFDTFFQARWLFFTGTNQGKLVNTFTREISMVGDAFLAMALVLSGVFRLVIFMSVPFYLSWQATSVTLLSCLLFAIPLFLLGPLNYRLGKLNTFTANQYIGIINECLGSIKVILGFGEGAKTLNLIGERFDAHRDVTLKSQTLATATPLIYEPLGLLAVFGAILTAQNYSVPFSDIAVMLWAFMKAMPQIGQVIERKNVLENLFPSFEQVNQVKEQAKNFMQSSGTKDFPGFNSKICFRNVDFSYATGEPVLNNINFDIPKGKMVAVVGKSGAGKSTLIDMVMGFNPPSKGEIKIDDSVLSEFDIVSLRQRIGYVPQESILFNLSIRDNMLWANEKADESDIWEACKLANADQFIEGFPNSLDTIVGDRGVRLSGGQAQRIALARAILRKPDLLILDEATSALDSEAERSIQTAIEKIAKKTTILAVAHRLSTVARADYIYLLEEGSVAEEGSYQDLINLKGKFQKMVKMQTLG